MDDDVSAPELDASYFFAAVVWGLMALGTPLIAIALGTVIEYRDEGGDYSLGFTAVAILMSATCATASYFAWRTQKQTKGLPLKRRVSYLMGAISAVMLLFWVVGGLALSVLGPAWR